MAKTRNSAGVNAGGQGSKNVNPLYKAATSFTSYLGNVAREVRDIPTAIGAPKQIQSGMGTRTTRAGDSNKKETYTVPKYKGNQASGIGSQLKEAAAALTSGQKGTSVGHVSASGKVKPRKSR
jgi:hypothetical protein